MYKIIDFVFDFKGFGADIRANRLTMGWTQAQLAEHLGHEGSYISRTERGVVSNCGILDILSLCNLFDLKPAKYFLLKED